MVSAVPSVVSMIIKRDSLISLVLNKVSNNCYFHNVSSRDTISSRPMLPDPYESKMISVSICKDVQRGEGIFVKVNVESDTILAFYNGIRLVRYLLNANEMCESLKVNQ